MATEFGLSAQMMLFAGDQQRKLASQVLPIAEVLDRVKKLSVASEANDKKRLSASVMFTLGDLQVMNTIVKLAKNCVGKFSSLQIEANGKYDDSKNDTLFEIIKSLIKITPNPDNDNEIKTNNETAEKNKAYLQELGLGKIDTDAKSIYISNDDKSFTQNGLYLLEVISLSNDSNTFNVVKTIYEEVDKVIQLDNDKKLLLESYTELSTKFEEFKGTQDLNLVEIVKDVNETKIESIAPVRIKKETLVGADDLKIDAEMAKWIPKMTTIEQFSFDYKEKTGAFEIIIKPGKDFPTNKKPSMFYLNRASMLLKRTLPDDKKEVPNNTEE